MPDAPKHDALATEDPIAMGRYAYALAAGAEGDWRAAAEVLEQTLELAPRWAAAWFALGEARERLGERPAAAAAFARTRACDPSDPFGAGARLALLGGDAATALPPAYVARLFDEYAPRFDAHLKSALDYRAPQLIAAAIDRVAPGRRFARALDLGCGTGLAGAALRERVDELCGVDLSERMIAAARARGVYTKLEIGEVADYLGKAPARGADLIVAADVLVYFGDLTPVFAAAARALAPGGLFAFTLEALVAGEGFRLGATMRFAHAPDHVERAAAAAGFQALELQAASTRREAGRDAAGWLGVATASASAPRRARAGSRR